MRAKKLQAGARDIEVRAESRLWRAVIANAIQEWISGPLRYRREAEEFLFGSGKDLALVCESAGLDAGQLRAELVRIREHAGDGYRFGLVPA